MKRFKLLDIFLLPRELYGKIGASKWTLIPVALLIGVADVLSPLTDRLPALAMKFNALGAGRVIVSYFLQVAIAGIIDIVFFTIPLFVIFNYFNKENEITSQPETFIKLIKVYALSHLIVIPVNELIYFTVSRLDTESSKILLAFVAVYFYFIMRFWFSGIITRGINVLYKFERVHGNLVFLVVFFWNMLLGKALVFIVDRFISRLVI